MKNLNKFFVGAAALVLLTACGPAKVSYDKFHEKAVWPEKVGRFLRFARICSAWARIYTFLRLKRKSDKGVWKTDSEGMRCTLPRAARQKGSCTSAFLKFLPGFFQEAAFPF